MRLSRGLLVRLWWYQVNGKAWHTIDEASITVVHGGFKTKKSKKKSK